MLQATLPIICVMCKMSNTAMSNAARSNTMMSNAAKAKNLLTMVSSRSFQLKPPKGLLHFV